MPHTASLRMLGAFVAALVFAGACGGDSDAETTAEAPAAAEPAVQPDEPEAPTTGLAWRTIEVVDRTRPTDEVVDGEGTVLLAASDTRTIPVEVLYEGAGGGGEDAPAAEAPARPLVVWMNGLGGMAAAGDPLLLALYDAGYTVAAPNSPEISAPASSPADFPELPADAALVIDGLVDPSDGVADDLSPLVDPERIGMAGHSIGASAVLASAFHDCCRDERVSAAVTFGASTAFRFDDTDYDFGDTPLLLVHGDSDRLFPVAESETILAGADEQSHLLVLPGADHFEPVYGVRGSVAGATSREAVVAFFDVHLAGTATAESLDEFGSGLPTGTWRSTDTGDEEAGGRTTDSVTAVTFATSLPLKPLTSGGSEHRIDDLGVVTLDLGRTAPASAEEAETLFGGVEGGTAERRSAVVTYGRTTVELGVVVLPTAFPNAFLERNAGRSSVALASVRGIDLRLFPAGTPATEVGLAPYTGKPLGGWSHDGSPGELRVDFTIDTTEAGELNGMGILVTWTGRVDHEGFDEACPSVLVDGCPHEYGQTRWGIGQDRRSRPPVGSDNGPRQGRS